MLQGMSKLAMLANLATVKEFAMRGWPAYKWLGTGNKPLPISLPTPAVGDMVLTMLLEPVWHV